MSPGNQLSGKTLNQCSLPGFHTMHQNVVFTMLTQPKENGLFFCCFYLFLQLRPDE